MTDHEQGMEPRIEPLAGGEAEAIAAGIGRSIDNYGKRLALTHFDDDEERGRVADQLGSPARRC